MRKEAATEEWKKLYDLAIQFKKMKPWKNMYNDEFLAISFSEEETAYFTVMGNGGMTYGFSMYMGLEGLNSLTGLMDKELSDMGPEYIMAEQDCISMLIAEKDIVPEEDMRVIRELGLSFRGKNNWIYFVRYEKGYMPYSLNQEEVALCTKYLGKFLEALKSYQKEHLKPFYSNHMLYVYYDNGGKWEGCFKRTPLEHFEMPRSVFPNLEQIKKLKKVKKTNAVWEADCFAMYRGITDDAYDKPLNERYFLVMDQKLNMVLDNQLLLPEDGAREVMNRLESIILENGRPKKVIVPNQIVGSMLKTLCDACGIRLVVDETECCEEYKLITSGQIDPERIMEELEELGIDIDKLNENISKMTQEEFVENMMAELEEVLGEEFGDLWDIDEVEHELKNRKQKVCAVKEFFGQGILPEEYYDEVEKWIESDWADDWEELLMQSTKLQLLDMAVQMGILTGKNTSKGALANTIMHTAKKDAGTLIGLLTGDELKMLKMLEDDMDDMTWNMEGEFPFAMEQILKLLGFGLVDIGYFTGEADITLVVKPVREVMELIAN